MRTAASSLSLGSLCLCLAACATGPNTFSKADVSASQKESDEAACWNYVLNTPEGRKEVDALKVARFIGGGVISLAVQSAEDQSKGNDPKMDGNNKLVHQTCMQQKGYTTHIG